MKPEKFKPMASYLQTEVDATLLDFDPSLTQLRPQHDLYSKAQQSLREQGACALIEQALETQEAGSIMLHGVTYVSRGDGCPDKPGTVRKPGIRRQFGSNRKQRWASY